MTAANWPRDRFGVDLTRAIPSASTIINGVATKTPGLSLMPLAGDIVGNIVTVVDATADIPAGTEYIIVQRTGAGGTLATTINLPSVLVQVSPILLFDWSSNFTEHTITVTPSGAETIAQAATHPMVSVDDGSFLQLTSGLFIPFSALLGWGAR